MGKRFTDSKGEQREYEWMVFVCLCRSDLRGFNGDSNHGFFITAFVD